MDYDTNPDFNLMKRREYTLQRVYLSLNITRLVPASSVSFTLRFTTLTTQTVSTIQYKQNDNTI
jgi:hypothetical protein